MYSIIGHVLDILVSGMLCVVGVGVGLGFVLIPYSLCWYVTEASSKEVLYVPGKCGSFLKPCVELIRSPYIQMKYL